MTLPRSDIAYLDERGIVHEIASESGMICCRDATVAASERVGP